MNVGPVRPKGARVSSIRVTLKGMFRGFGFALDHSTARAFLERASIPPR